MWWLIFIIVFAGLGYWFREPILTTTAGIWADLVTSYGYGLAILFIWLVTIIALLARRRFKVFARYWNYWLGALFFSGAMFGILSFFEGPPGLLKEASLGGLLGTIITGAADALGALRIFLMVLIGMFFITPRRTWRFLDRSIKVFYRAIYLSIKYFFIYSYRLLAGLFRALRSKADKKPAPARSSPPDGEPSQPVTGVEKIKLSPNRVLETVNKVFPVKSKETMAKQPEADTAAETAVPAATSGRWQLPPIKLLENPPQVEFGQADIDKRARLIEEALGSYGVEAKVVQTNVGPTVTQFGVEPGWDRKFKEVKEKDKDGNVHTRLDEISRTRVKVERIASLSNDLALALAAPSIRIEAPVPGKPIVGVEVPNSIMGLATLRGVIESQSFAKMKSRTRLTIALGKGPGGESICADLSKMPHLLVAGATGSGKTVCLNSVICSLLMYNTPDELQFLMVDPKRVELVSFNSIPHLISPVVIDNEKAVAILKWLNQEMDKRYRKLAAAGVRNIETYHKNSKDTRNMPYLVMIIDELADLMMSKAEEVEPSICRLAQLARATGIHLVVATQRPSVDVITGLIKANFPTRISFAVASQVDSRTILDSAGAEKLLGRGDMLYLPPESPKPKRLQGCYVSDQEIDRIVRFWSQQRDQKFLITDQMFEAFADKESKENEDSLLEEARELARSHTQISTSFLQRRLRIGYPRAARLAELLQQEKNQAPDRAKPDKPDNDPPSPSL